MANIIRPAFSKQDLIFDGIQSMCSPERNWAETECFIFRLPEPNNAAFIFIEVSRPDGSKRTFSEIDASVIEHIHGLNTYDEFEHHRLTNNNVSSETI